MKKIILFLFVNIFSFLFCSLVFGGDNIRDFEKVLNNKITFYNIYSLNTLPELGLLYCNASKYSDDFLIIDPDSEKITKLCKRGGGPDNFKLISAVFSNEDKIYIQDSSLSQNKLLVYSAGNFSLNDVLSAKKMGNKYIKLLGKYKNKYFGHYFHSYAPKNIFEENDIVGQFSNNFKFMNEVIKLPKEYKKIPLYDTSFLHAKILNNQYLVIFFGPNFDSKTGIFKLELIDLNTKLKKIVLFKIPKRFFKWSKYDKTTELYFLSKAYIGLDYKATPTGFRSQGLDQMIYFTYLYYIDEANIETLINVLDLRNMKTFSYVFKSKKGIIPYLFSDDVVYCTDNTSEDYKLKILKKSDVINKVNMLNK